MDSSPDFRTTGAFTAAVFIGGANFIAVSYSNMELPPVFGATIRFALAGLIFLLLCAVVRVPLARGRAALGAAAYGLLGFGAAYAFLYYSLVGLPAGVAAVVIATAPLFTLILAILLGQETLSIRGLVAGGLAVGGIAVLSLDTLQGDVRGSYLVAAMFGAMSIAGSSVVARSFREVHPLSMNAIGMMAGTALLAVTSLALGEAWAIRAGAATWAAVAWLVVLGSVGLFQLFLYVIRRWTASATVYAVAAMPVVAAGLGVVLLDQPVTPGMVAGGAMVMVAVYVGAVRRSGAAAAMRATSPPPGES